MTPRSLLALAALSLLAASPVAAQGYARGAVPQDVLYDDVPPPYPGRVYTTAPSLDQPSRNAYSVIGQSEGYADAGPGRSRRVAAAPSYYDPYGDFDDYGQATGRPGGRSDVPAAAAIPRETVSFDPSYAPGTIVVRSAEKRLYFVTARGEAIRYGVGVGRPGFGWNGTQTVSAMKEWPDWTPPAEMLRRRPELPRRMAGGIENPLGARAMYLGSSLYRIHGSNEPETIGTSVSSGCIRMLNEDVVDLYQRVRVGTKVIVI